MSSPADAVLDVHSRGRVRRSRLTEYLDPRDTEEAERSGNAWIKSLRHAHVDGRSLRDRFTYRGESLWWFAEIYLHKQRTSVDVFRTILGFDGLIRRERPDRLAVVSAGRVVRALGPAIAARHAVPYDGPDAAERRTWRAALAARLAPGIYAASPALQRWRRGRVGATPKRVDLAVFVHSAFWKQGAGEDTYLGPVLEALSATVDPERIALVGVGPQTNFRARTWRHRLRELGGAQPSAALTPIESFSSVSALAGSRALWRDRAVIRRALLASDDLRAASMMREVDAWSVMGRDLSGLATLQFPWSARAMDEAGAALDALRPRVVLTYAEAGGWGRALTLEARRRDIRVVGVQHGFISRHWLNYQHEIDETVASSGRVDDRGYPFPTATLLYDSFARQHLLSAGHFPEETLQVVGNQRLDVLVAAARRLTPADFSDVRRAAGAQPGQQLVVLAAKRIPEFDDTFAALMQAVSAMPDVHLAVRPHPAETAEPYERLAAGIANVRVVPLSVDPVALMAAARLVATINSTVAIEAMALDVPSLAMRLPNYLTPFVEEGAMAGTTTLEEIGPAVARLVHDDEERRGLSVGRQRFIDRYAMTPDGRATERTVAAVIALLS